MKAPGDPAVNPTGKVPAIVHGDTVVTGAAAICADLADGVAEAGLAPSPGARGACRRWLVFGAGPGETAVMARGIGPEMPPARSGRIGFGSVERTFSTLERALGASHPVTGDRFTAADVNPGAQVMCGPALGLMPKRPALEAFRPAAALDAAAAN